MRENLSPRALANIYIGFDFSFDMTESNKATGGILEFFHPYGGGAGFSLNLKGGADKSRRNQRFVRVIDSFQTLKDYKFCTEAEEGANLIYPISGSVGVDEIIHTFIKVERLSELASKDGKIFSDTLTFTTNLTAGITPTLNLNTPAGSLNLKRASIDASVERKDIHQVAIAISPKAGATDVSDLIGERRFARGAAVSVQNPASSVILELERLRNRDEDLRAFDTLRDLQ